MILRDYQSRAVENISAAWGNHRSALVVLPTGCGKTVVFASVIPNSPRTLVLAHREELVNQARDKIVEITGLDTQIEMAEQTTTDFFGDKCPVVVSTIQTQMAGRRYEKFKPEDFGLIIVDEAHHATSKSYREVVGYYMNGNSNCHLLGVTATPDRSDHVALGKVFESVAFEYRIDQAIEDGWLVPIKQQMVLVDSLDFSKIKTTAGDLNGRELADLMEEEENLHKIAAPTYDICKGKRSLVFTASVKQAERLAEILNRYGAGCADWVCGETDKMRRRDILQRFKSGGLQFLVNVGVLTEGFDDAGVEAVVMARPTKSRALYAQMAGRGTRPAAEIASRLGEITNDELGITNDGGANSAAAKRRQLIDNSTKPSCLILDFVGNAGRHKLVTSADILGGKYDDEVVERAKRRIKDRGDAADVEEALTQAKEEIEAEKRKVAERRRKVRAKAKYSTRIVDAFNELELYEMMPGETERRNFVGQATIKQERFFLKRGIEAPLRRAEATRWMNKIAIQEGWRNWRKN